MLYVNTNVSSLTAQRSLSNINTPLNQTFQRLSSGFRINSAADDAAGLQISNRLTSQINGMDQGVRNANDGISLAQVAEGALDEMSNSIQRIRTLVIQANNGINSLSDKGAIQKEIKALSDEISRIATTTKFGDIPLLDGSLTTKFLVGANGTPEDYIPIELDRIGGYTSAALGIDQVFVGDPGVIEPAIPGTEYGAGATFDFPSNIIGNSNALQVNVNGTGFVNIPFVEFGVDTHTNTTDAFAAAIKQVRPDFDYTRTGAGGIQVNSGTLQFKTKFIAPYDENGLDSIYIFTGFWGQPAYYSEPPLEGESAEFNLGIIDNALKEIDEARANLGSTQNRFQATIRNLSNISENVSAARSRIRDTDFAKETAELTRLQILQQASTTVLSQANQRPQAALTLLQ
jgi:flagellin